MGRRKKKKGRKVMKTLMKLKKKKLNILSTTPKKNARSKKQEFDNTLHNDFQNQLDEQEKNMPKEAQDMFNDGANAEQDKKNNDMFSNDDFFSQNQEIENQESQNQNLQASITAELNMAQEDFQEASDEFSELTKKQQQEQQQH